MPSWLFPKDESDFETAPSSCELGLGADKWSVPAKEDGNVGSDRSKSRQQIWLSKPTHSSSKIESFLWMRRLTDETGMLELGFTLLINSLWLESKSSYVHHGSYRRTPVSSESAWWSVKQKVLFATSRKNYKGGGVIVLPVSCQHHKQYDIKYTHIGVDYHLNSLSLCTALITRWFSQVISIAFE